tara:strand:- start:280 stop:504 length:225 start_codon:yes stop_codon:yes gene_type:complete
MEQAYIQNSTVVQSPHHDVDLYDETLGLVTLPVSSWAVLIEGGATIVIYDEAYEKSTEGERAERSGAQRSCGRE